MERFLPHILALLIITVCISTVSGPKNIFHLMKFRREIAELQSMKEVQMDQIQRLDSAVDTAARDRLFLERKAREELALSKQDEVIYFFSNAEPLAP